NVAATPAGVHGQRHAPASSPGRMRHPSQPETIQESSTATTAVVRSTRPTNSRSSPGSPAARPSARLLAAWFSTLRLIASPAPRRRLAADVPLLVSIHAIQPPDQLP